jgi:DNA-binding CsgD family transcriptional regulator
MTLTNITLHLPTEKLTPREIEILTLTAYGKTRGEISQILSIKRTTVKEHMERAFHKLDATNNTHASTVAVALGLIAPYRLPINQQCSRCRAARVLPMEDAQAQKHQLLPCRRSHGKTGNERS